MKLKYYFQINWLKSFCFNFKMLPFKDAVKLPVVIFFRTQIRSLRGKVNITSPVSHAMIKIGRCEVSHFQTRSTILSIDGTVNFSGKASLGRGSALEVGKTGLFSSATVSAPLPEPPSSAKKKSPSEMNFSPPGTI